jgi:hypothetical protein
MKLAKYPFDARKLWDEPAATVSARRVRTVAPPRPVALTLAAEPPKPDLAETLPRTPATLALIALMVPRRATASRTRKCAERLRRRLGRLETITNAGDEVAAAGTLIRTVCAYCRKCPGA